MLHLLGGCNQCQVGGDAVLFLPVLDHLVSLFEQASHSLARFCPGLGAEQCEAFLQPFHLLCGFFEMVLESKLQTGRRCSLREFG